MRGERQVLWVLGGTGGVTGWCYNGRKGEAEGRQENERQSRKIKRERVKVQAKEEAGGGS